MRFQWLAAISILLCGAPASATVFTFEVLSYATGYHVSQTHCTQQLGCDYSTTSASRYFDDIITVTDPANQFEWSYGSPQAYPGGWTATFTYVGGGAWAGTNFHYEEGNNIHAGDQTINATYLDAATFTVRQLSPTPLPEPETWAMLIAGFALVGGAMRHRTLVRRPKTPRVVAP